MSAPKHTPGPWTSYSDRTVGASGLPLLRCYAGRNEEANARLIAAAPNLLDACAGSLDAMMRAADLLEHAGRREDAERLRRQADECRAAIAKATQP